MSSTPLAVPTWHGQITQRLMGWLYVTAGAIGLAASAILMIEKVASLADPDYVASCSINPVIACGSVMDSSQAEAFGFPNPILGIAVFSVVITTGVVILAGFDPPRWYRLGLQLGTTLGVIFVHWLIYQSLYFIGALCPYCMIVWVVTIAIFWYTTLHNLPHRSLPSRTGTATASMLTRYHAPGLALWYVAIAALILHAFWDYWTSQL